MLLYILLDWSTDVILWLVKNIGYGSYYTICYLFGYSSESKEEEEKKNTLVELIEQKKDIEEIKSLLLELQQNQEKKD
jgi:hypothetical protein